MAYPEKIRVILFRESDWWVAQCLEFDLAAQGKTWVEAIGELERVINGRIVVCQREGIDPFDLPKAPQIYEELFKKAAPVEFNEVPTELPPGFLAFMQQKEIRLSKFI